MSDTSGGINQVVGRVAKRFPWRRRGSAKLDDERNHALREMMSQNSHKAAELVKLMDYKGAIEKYEAALEAANELHMNDDGENGVSNKMFGSSNRRHKDKRNIIEKMADVYMLWNEPEQALVLFTDLKDEFAETPNDRRYKDFFKKEMLAMEKVNQQQRRKLKVEFDQLYKMGEINIKIGSYDRARTYFLKAMNIVKMKFGVEHEHILALKEHLGDIHVLKDEIDDAKEVYRSILPGLESKFGEDHERYMTVVTKLEEIDVDRPERRSFLGY